MAPDGQRWPPIDPMALDCLIGGRGAMEPWDHPSAIDGHREPCMAYASLHYLDLHQFGNINI